MSLLGNGLVTLGSQIGVEYEVEFERERERELVRTPRHSKHGISNSHAFMVEPINLL